MKKIAFIEAKKERRPYGFRSFSFKPFLKRLLSSHPAIIGSAGNARALAADLPATTLAITARVSTPAAITVAGIRVAIAADERCHVDATTPAAVMTVPMTMSMASVVAVTSVATAAVTASDFDKIARAGIGVNGCGQIGQLPGSRSCRRGCVACRSECTHQDDERGESPTLRTIHCFSPELLPDTLPGVSLILPDASQKQYRSNLRDHLFSRGTRRKRRIGSVEKYPE